MSYCQAIIAGLYFSVIFLFEGRLMNFRNTKVTQCFRNVTPHNAFNIWQTDYETLKVVIHDKALRQSLLKQK